KSGVDFFTVWGGIAGCQSSLALLATEGMQRGIVADRIAEVTSLAVARRFNIAAKGRIEIGYDADLALVDPAEAKELTRDDLEYRHKLSPYIGRHIHRVVRATFLRGMQVAGGGGRLYMRRGRLVRPSVMH